MTFQSVAKYTTNCSVGEVENYGKTNCFIGKLTCTHFEVSRLVTMINLCSKINCLNSSVGKIFTCGSEGPKFESGQSCHVFFFFLFLLLFFFYLFIFASIFVVDFFLKVPIC